LAVALSLVVALLAAGEIVVRFWAPWLLGEPAGAQVLSIRLAPDTVFRIGGLAVTNTMLSVWLASALLLLMLALALGRPRLAPKGVQNAVEFVLEAIHEFMQNWLRVADESHSGGRSPWSAHCSFSFCSMPG
jgi:hypothetical protein